ncbi:MAG TPA: response regulator transcription factor [Dissulfurispiraceae bacterium]|nr:response regulator transcription factor [Dissulfurispiraceae bacterium]
MIQVLFVEDHAIVREGLKQILADTNDIVIADEAVNGEEALDKIKERNFDVVVLDISMPGRSGLEVLKELKGLHPKLPVLMLSMYPEELYAIRSFKSGASGYLSKESATTELITAIRRVSSGGKYISPSLAESLAVNLQEDDGNPPHARLSEREYQILCLIAAGKAGKEIAADLKLSAKTVSTYRTRVLDKMGMKTNAELTHYALQNKLVF